MELTGFLNINKPSGLTSHDVVAKTRRLLKIKRVGHTGTLDPMATGVLVLCLGRATRLIRFLDESEKCYRAVIRLGMETDTGDREGKPTATTDPTGITLENVKNGCRLFQGDIYQVPPMYSAIKQNGKKLYELARAGKKVDRPPRRVRISRIDIVNYRNPLLSLDITCSRGTYIRSLARDLGRELGCGAHLAELERTRSGCFAIEDAHTPEELARRCQTGPPPLIAPARALSHLAGVTITDEGIKRIINGMPVGEKDICRGLEEAFENKPVSVCNTSGELIAIGEVSVENNRAKLHPRVVIG